MKVDISKTVSVTITLTEFETKWLKALVQNPRLDSECLACELPKDREMRQLFWDSLPDLE